MGVHILQPEPMTFIHLKKSGGTSVSNWLMNNMPLENRFRFNKHSSLDWANKNIKNTGFTFTIVRNPYDREVSWYYYMIQKATKRLNKLKNKQLSGKIEKEYHYCLNVVEKYAQMGFKEYTMSVPHLNPQFQCIKGIDYIIRYENLDEEIETIKDRLNIKAPLPHVNQSRHKNYRSYYDDELKEYVYKKHYIDFKTFDYNF